MSSFKKCLFYWVWWHKPVSPALRTLRQEDSLSLDQPTQHSETLTQKKKKKKRKVCVCSAFWPPKIKSPFWNQTTCLIQRQSVFGSILLLPMRLWEVPLATLSSTSSTLARTKYYLPLLGNPEDWKENLHNTTSECHLAEAPQCGAGRIIWSQVQLSFPLSQAHSAYD